MVKKEVDRSRAVSAYTTIITILGFVIVGIAFQYLPQNRLGLILFAGLACLAELFSVELFASSHTRISISNIIAIACFLLFGPLAGVITMLTVCVMTLITTGLSPQKKGAKGRASWLQRGTFNLGMLVIAIAGGGTTFALTGGVSGTILMIENLLPLLLGVFVTNLLNIVLLIGVISIQTGRYFLEIWDRDFRWVVPISVLGGVIGGASLAMAYEMFGTLGAAVFFLPIFLINYSYRIYVANTKEYANKLEEMNQSLEEANLGLLESLGRVIDAYDVYTYGHSTQVAVYASDIAKKMALPAEDQLDLMRASLIHDIGKVGIKESILSKPGPLSPAERAVINRHPDIGANIIGQMKGLQKLVPLVRHHHERWDGHGYPDGLVGHEIPLGARILSVADALDVMGSDRPYRKAMSFSLAKEELMRCSGTQFDPEVVRAFLKLAEEKGNQLFENNGSFDRDMNIDHLWKSESIMANLKGGRQ